MTQCGPKPIGVLPLSACSIMFGVNVSVGSISDMRGVSARCLLVPISDIGGGAFMSTRPS
jgi:hypothetical protein